jgi:hypothetical protein
MDMEISGKVLLASNLAAIVLAVVFSYVFAAVVWSYWAESVIIGLFTLLSLVYIGEGLRGASFVLRYGAFHFAYFLFLSIMTISGEPILQSRGLPEVWSIVSASCAGLITTPFALLIPGIFFASHAFSFYQNKIVRKEGGKPADIMKRAYARIAPMHITIMFGWIVYAILGGSGAGIGLLVLFMGIKTFVDLKAHEAKHGGGGAL